MIIAHRYTGTHYCGDKGAIEHFDWPHAHEPIDSVHDSMHVSDADGLAARLIDISDVD